MSIQGIFASNQGIVGERAGDFANAILQINPTGTAPMLALTSGMGKAPAADTIFNWFEDSHVSGRTGTTSGGTTSPVVVDDGSAYVPGAILMVEETGEYMLVTAVNGNSLTVSRGLAGTAITSIDGSMNVQLIGNAHEEGAARPTAVTQQGHPRMNYVQIFRNGWAITGTAKAVKYITGSKLAKNKRDCALYHAEDMERTLIWGKKHLGTLNGKQFRMTDGILSQIEQYDGVVESATDGTTPGNYNLERFRDFIRRVFAKNVKGQPNERIAFSGDLVLQVLQTMTLLDTTYQITQAETKVGITINTIVTPFGTLKLMTHPLMNENPVWQHEMYVLHPGGIRRRILRDTFEEGYDQNGKRIDGVDADEGLITTEFGVEVGASATMGILRDVQVGVKSFV